MSSLEYKKQIYTVGQINTYIKQLIESDFLLKNICIKGELSNCKYHSGGHIYFSLKDETGVISAVMFKSKAASLKIRLKDGMQVVVTGSLGVYEPGGRYQIYASKIEEAGQGDLFKKFAELKEKLEESGMFASEYKKPIPKFAMKIGVVTSETGAVIQDIRNVALRRNPYCKIFLYPAIVQGENAKQSIVKGLKKLDSMELDVIITGRGGGSIEDLWAFNEEEVARAIFSCSTPVISAVGHETDFTIADFVADLRAPTPSAAAELAVFSYDEFQRKLADISYTLGVSMDGKLAQCKKELADFKFSLEKLSPGRQIEVHKKLIAQMKQELEKLMSAQTESTRNLLEKHKQTLDIQMQNAVRSAKEALSVKTATLEGLSPLKRLSAGYAYVACEDGKTLKSIKQIDKGDRITLSVTDGEALAEVIEKRDSNGK